MSDSLSPMASPSAAPMPSLEALVQAHQSLRSAFHVTLVMFVILTGSLFVFFLREVSLARRQINELTQVVAEYEKNAVPLMEDFRTKLQVFARSHPDFQPIYTRYFGMSNASPSAASPGGKAQPAGANPAGARMPPGR
jgi:hypothetical protein